VEFVGGKRREVDGFSVRRFERRKRGRRGREVK